MEESRYNLDSHLCFSLYACSRAIFRMYRPLLDELNLTYPQYLVLLVLWDQQESSIKELSQLLSLDSGTLTPMLKRMETSGLLERSRSQEDERIVTVRITEKGRELQDRAACIPAAMLESSGLDPKQIGQLNESIRALMASVENYR
ncbi:MarR family transcriptional regulator [Saccharibacillus sp. CPCC 101409]|uniref:MarR family winged helix-turn-helix transcriptional regulator n=1 Tax=Saccharibacillus sp. CPCC 101409 TaxID=3058041 RepID=UPI0026735E25|nr:MarR family transcriptional regulator [Saccharibacillus sp. CPCC 101409]MDO3411660.1 MarR family transcriptional regulator [Saccharibacillus sp. CPCC 101409]